MVRHENKHMSNIIQTEQLIIQSLILYHSGLIFAPEYYQR